MEERNLTFFQLYHVLPVSIKIELVSRMLKIAREKHFLIQFFYRLKHNARRTTAGIYPMHQHRMRKSDLRGMTLNYDTILINTLFPRFEQEKTLAHEIGHLLLDLEFKNVDKVFLKFVASYHEFSPLKNKWLRCSRKKLFLRRDNAYSYSFSFENLMKKVMLNFTPRIYCWGCFYDVISRIK
jgi:hypothetical protein